MILTFCWTISAIVSYTHLKNFRCLQQDLNPLKTISSIHLSTTLYKTFFIHSSFLSRECMSPTNWPWSHLSGFIAQLVRALHWHRRAHVFESNWRQLKFFRGIYEAIIESDCLTKCEDHFFNSSLHNTSQNIFHSLIIIIIMCKLNINF